MSKSKKTLNIVNNRSKVPDAATKISQSTESQPNVVVKFSSCDENKYCLYSWGKSELKLLVKALKKLESMTWLKAKADTGFQIKPVKNKKLPKSLSKDITLQEIRINDTSRLHGYHLNNHFYIVWFDNNHNVCP